MKRPPLPSRGLLATVLGVVAGLATTALAAFHRDALVAAVPAPGGSRLCERCTGLLMCFSPGSHEPGSAVADAMANARRLGSDLPTEVTAIMKSGRFHKRPGTLA
jgi:hypothetical protein